MHPFSYIQEVLDAVKQFAGFADSGKSAIETSDWTLFAELMNKNFDLRRQIYGDKCLGQGNLTMVEIGRNFGAACKFPGR